MRLRLHGFDVAAHATADVALADVAVRVLPAWPWLTRLLVSRSPWPAADFWPQVYDFWAFPDRRRLRVSQVLVPPPFQERGLGKALLAAAYGLAQSRPAVLGLTVGGRAGGRGWLTVLLLCICSAVVVLLRCAAALAAALCRCCCRGCGM